MERPNSTQVAAAQAILKKFTQLHGATASDTMLSKAVYSVASVLGAPGEPAQEYADAVAQATGGDIKVRPMVAMHNDGSVTIGLDNPFGIPAGTYYPPKDEDELEEEEPTLDALPDEDELGKMTKAEIVAQAEAEGIEDIDKGDPNKDTLIERLIAGRSQV